VGEKPEEMTNDECAAVLTEFAGIAGISLKFEQELAGSRAPQTIGLLA
jgi:hypothetical protein